MSAKAAGWPRALHPDEVHDGRARAEGGFSYRLVYVEPAGIAEAVRATTCAAAAAG